MRYLAAMVLLALALAGLAGWASLQGQKNDGPPAVRKAECRRATGPVRVNGVLDEVAWENAVELKDFAVFWQKRRARTATTAKLLWDDRYLYFCAEMEDHDLFALTKEHNGMTWEDDVFE